MIYVLLPVSVETICKDGLHNRRSPHQTLLDIHGL